MAEVTKNEAAGRYEARVDGELVGQADFRVEGDLVVLHHTEVDPTRRGQGLAEQLAQVAMDDIRRSGRRVRPDCSYMAAWLAEHPDYGDLVAE